MSTPKVLWVVFFGTAWLVSGRVALTDAPNDWYIETSRIDCRDVAGKYQSEGEVIERMFIQRPFLCEDGWIVFRTIVTEWGVVVGAGDKDTYQVRSQRF